jgi:RNA-directed DNA polymerase
MVVRRNTNSIRRGVMVSLQRNGEAWNSSQALAWWTKRLADHPCGWRRNVGKGRRDKRGDLCAGVTACRSQSPHSTEAGVSRPQTWATQTGGREGGQEGGCVKDRLNDQQTAASVPATARRAASDPASAGSTPVGESHAWDAWDWVDREVWTERMLAALVTASSKGNQDKWFSLIDKVWRDSTLNAAWQQVRSRRGASGIDGVSIAVFEAQAMKYLSELAEQLKTGSYRAQAVRRVEIPKTGGGSRPLGIPTVKDRVVQAAVKRVIEPIFESQFCETSYGFRPGRGCKDALRAVDGWLRQGYTHVVDADLKSYFDSIPQERLLARVGERISDGRVLALIDGWLKQDIVHELKRWTPTGGTPQGAVLSPLLANIYLHPLDEHMLARGYRMVRYADDFVILCQSAQEAQQALDEVAHWVNANGLVLNMDKTHVGDCLQKGQGFEFLGYRFEAGRRMVRKKSQMKLKDAIRQRTGRTRSGAMRGIVSELNAVLRGWYAYFRHAVVGTFDPLDGFVRRRLRALLRKRDKRPGQGRCQEDTRRWPNAYFATLGLFTMSTVRRSASQSR